MDENRNILLIDDDPDIHDAVTMILEPEGYKLTCCKTGPAGMGTARRLQPALILLDIMLSSPTEGLHIAYEMKDDDVLKDIPIIMLSSIGAQTGIDYAREVGTEYVPATAFLNKPFDARALRQAVDEALHPHPTAGA